MMQQDSRIHQRRFDLDWLRVIAIFMVFVFHSSRFFDTYDWHVKNATTYQWVQLWTMFQSNWGMPLIFVISGASIFFSVGKIGKFIKSKTLRLLVPLVVGILTHVSIAVYLERRTHYQFFGSFFQFIPKYFQGLYPVGNFAWMGLHLWYLLVLFIFSLLFLPLFYILKDRWNNFLGWLGNIFAFPGMIYSLAIPVILPILLINPNTLLGGRNWGGWSLPAYIPFFIYGFLIISHEGIQVRIKDYCWLSLTLAMLCIASLVLVYNQFGEPSFSTWKYTLLFSLFGLNAWLWVLTIIGFGMRYLNFYKPILFYANEAVLPFYILHQTVLLIIGFYVTRWQIPDLGKFVIIASISFMFIMVLYEFLIRRMNILRFLFGMKLKVKSKTVISPASSQVNLKPY
jgi:glucan biosynthesis protein C